MRNTPRARRPVMALAAPAIIATAGLLSACSPAHSGTPVAQPSPQTSQGPVSQQTSASGQSPASPAPASPAPAPQPQPLPVAKHLDPARFSMVTVSADLPMDGSLRFHKSFRSPAVIARLTRTVNGLSAAKSLSTPCPSAEITYRLSFRAMGSGPGTVVTTGGCQTDRISVGGEPRQPLWDQSGDVAAAVKHLLKLKVTSSAS